MRSASKPRRDRRCDRHPRWTLRGTTVPRSLPLSAPSRTDPAAPSGTDWRWGVGSPSGAKQHDHPHGHGSHRSPGETTVKASSRGGRSARHPYRVTITRALVRGRVARWIRSDRRGPPRLLRRGGADVHGAHALRSARQGSAARHHEFARSSEEGFDRRRRPIEDVEASERDHGFAHVARRLAVRRVRGVAPGTLAMSRPVKHASCPAASSNSEPLAPLEFGILQSPAVSAAWIRRPVELCGSMNLRCR
jgi:hypothetical protein